MWYYLKLVFVLEDGFVCIVVCVGDGCRCWCKRKLRLWEKLIDINCIDELKYEK